MRKYWTIILGLGFLAIMLLPEIAAAAGGKAAPLAIVADTRHINNSLERWWANLYNASHMQFTILTVVIIPIVGLIFGLLADFIMNHIGIDLKSRELAEH